MLRGKIVLEISQEWPINGDARIVLFNGKRRVARVGEIVDIMTQRDLWPESKENRVYAICKTIALDADEREGFFYPCLHDNSFVRSRAGNVFFWLR